MFNLKNTYLDLPKLMYSIIAPSPVKSPELLIINEKLSLELGIDPELLIREILILSGNQAPKDSTIIAQAYAGHQFGHFTMLGDGRAMLLGEIETANGLYDIQLKGSGITPYSRGGDGRATIGPMLREYIISEAMHNLSIPTTRSLAVVKTGEDVYRETILEGAILTRVAQSHIRVGTFEFASRYGGKEVTKALADYTINRHYGDLVGIGTGSDIYKELLDRVVRSQSQLIANWMRVGFVHGVMNTDNMAISGETIDYGPCAFMDEYDLDAVFSSIDKQGRYSFSNQPQIANWNLARLAETLIPFLDANESRSIKIASDTINSFGKYFRNDWLHMMGAKLGIKEIDKNDDTLFRELLELMARYKADYTRTFVDLTIGISTGQDLYSSDEFSTWKSKWKERLGVSSGEVSFESKALMMSQNPAMIPRNHLVERALSEAIRGDINPLELLLKSLENPYDYSINRSGLDELPPKRVKPYVTFCGT